MAERGISIGIIGVSDENDDPLLRSLLFQQRMKLTAAYSGCYAKLELFARRLQIVPYGSVRRLAECDTLQGMIWSESLTPTAFRRWMTFGPAKHVVLREQVMDDCPVQWLAELQALAETRSVLIIPELTHRWTPATLRLRELIATNLGPIQRISLTATWEEDDVSSLVSRIDWLRMLLAVREVIVKPLTDPEGFRLDFVRVNQQPVSCQVRRSDATQDLDEPTEVFCECGVVRIESEHEIQWETGTGWNEEILDAERSAADVLLDLFGRRIAGGIVPIPDLNEILRSYRLIHALSQSLKQQVAVEVDDASLPVNNGELCF